MLVTSIFFFSHNCILSRTNFAIWITFNLSSANALNLEWSKILLFGKELTHYYTTPHFDALNTYSCGKHCKKQFLLFSQCFLPYMVLIFHFKCTLKCRLQFVSVWTILKFCGLVMGQHAYLDKENFF